ncbi:MAG: IucA/IucC family siderophore biosynthesis protein [Mesorhizobium sp.]|uniref:IucA/IucC family protein n=1 Tax=unclassified Mesorhizobium TaxID=325217 RepID=UPI000FC9D9E8|nr:MULTISPECIES: IucA/IucC family protein [unclassified Mesorhizobium]RUV67743.1 IucA/IucC family siderophore biosynthesis protein [Mesorhizobium sp. M5C.F.Cr.IN.023.01.1.1]RWF88382.1 MAG: IucA/IucC family siderophore biosynthesis protein [Mesorhizobium sp.]RWF89301.1 MAG: IucA/IucC family siderophore biosynthesis protein [Mesorhizobium sp.]RWJ06568.1 MAG: IucA/IucC family siderophore biosynthesis protein [Mesorhizobium sp.]RWJ11854.1 MAG: IucA/IucC family siderophore biosynthesis protein [Mes
MDERTSSAADAQTQARDARLWTDASRNALARLVRCLFAERLLEPNALLWAQDGRQAWFPLWPSRRVLHFTDLRRAPAGTLQNLGHIEVLDGTGARQRLDDPSALITEVSPALAVSAAPDGLAQLLRDVDNSMRNDVLARRHREGWSAELRQKIAAAGVPGFLAYLEQSLPPHLAAMTLDQWGALEGHPFYPTWKAKPGLPPQEVTALSPEFGARVRLRITALRKEWAYVEKMPHVGSYSEWFSQNFPDLWRDWAEGLKERGKSPGDWIPLPVHRWHLDNFVRREFESEIASGVFDPEGPEIVTLPSMSFRTMLPDTQEPRPFIKLPVAIWLTSEQRTLQAKSIHMGPRLSTLISDILAKEEDLRDTLEIFTEELGAILRHPDTGDEHPGRFLSVVFRNSDALARTDGLMPVTVAALLTAGPSDDRPLICELIARNGNEAEADVAAFFRAYARTVIRPTLAMYLLYGIAFEAHQQNSLVLFDHAGHPRKLLIRDFGDGRSFAPLFEERGHCLKPFTQTGILPTTFDEDISLVRSFVIDACFVCHLHEIALCLTEQYGLAGNSPWRILREETEEAFDALRPRVPADQFWLRERAAFLEDPWPTRSVLRMHLERYRDYRVEHQLPNPLTEAE